MKRQRQRQNRHASSVTTNNIKQYTVEIKHKIHNNVNIVRNLYMKTDRNCFSSFIFCTFSSSLLFCQQPVCWMCNNPGEAIVIYFLLLVLLFGFLFYVFTALNPLTRMLNRMTNETAERKKSICICQRIQQCCLAHSYRDRWKKIIELTIAKRFSLFVSF